MIMKFMLGGMLVLGGLFGGRGEKAAARVEGTTVHEIEHGGLTRQYRLHVPRSYDGDKPAALVFVFHGGKSNFEGVEKFTGFSDLADKEGFLVVYPNAVDENWNDGRGSSEITAQRENVDDVGFVAKIVDEVKAKYNVDPKRIYSTGISNGGIMSQRLAIEMSDTFAAIAPVVGGIAKPLAARFNPSSPVSVMVIQGVDDPIVQYEGGFVKPKRGETIPAEETVAKWVKRNGCSAKPKVEQLADSDPEDGCTVEMSIYSGGKDGTSVAFYKVSGMGHTWPGGRQYAPKLIIGRVCNDFDATQTIWKFFESHPKK